MSEKNILVVDDEPGIAQLCDRLLKKEGFSVTSFVKPREAMEYIKQNTADLLLVDIRMPEISGFDVIAQARQDQPDLAVLVMTGYGTVEMAIQALRQGVDGLILKPFVNAEELVDAVRQALADNQKKRDIARIQTLRALFDITESLLSETRPEPLLDLILNAICGHLRCDHAGIYQFSEDANRLNLLSGRGITLPEEKSNTEGGLIGRTGALNAPLWVNAVGPGEPALQRKLAKLKLSSAICVPVSRMNIRRVLYAGRGSGEPQFREVEWEMFLLLARQVILAMENARLYDELRDYVKRVEGSQQALVQAEKMATAGRLTASIAHEINNPLQAVRNCIHLAGRKEFPEKKREEYINLAETELERLMITVQRMLEFYRPGAVEPQRVDLPELLRRVISLLSPQLDSRNVRVTTGFSSSLPKVLAVSSQLQQVFINLILNAYDAMPKGGEVRITARPVKDSVEIIFQDTGPGVPAEKRNDIFEPFVSTKEGGTGLGLAVSYGIISAHGGILNLLPDRGPGACFRIMIPVKGKKKR
jgi:signal transduction histidine kinase/CheY-like chemotaxis protein